MSRPRRKRTRDHRAAVQEPSAPVAIASPAGAIPSPGGGGGIVAGGASPDRGYVYFPGLRAKYHFARAPRLEVIKKCRWLAYNDGNGRMLRHLADWIGPVSVQPATDDHAWNGDMKQLWEEYYVENRGYDGSGKMTSESYQAMIHFLQDRDGDVLNVWARTAADEPTVVLYDSTSIGEHAISGRRPDGDWLDGVRIGPMERPLAYSLLPEEWGGTPVILDAANTIMFAHHEVPEAVRGTPVLVHAADNMLDIREIDRDIKRAIKLRGLFGLAVENEGGNAPPIKGVQGKLVPANVPATTPSGAISTDTEVPRYKEEIFDSGGITRLPPHHKVRGIADERDAPSQEAVKADIYANIARGLGVRVQFIYMLEKLTGPGIRLVLSDVQDWRNRRLNRMLPFVRADYVRRVEWLIRTRRIRAPRDPRWWRCSYTYPRSLTIDAGRDQNGRINALKSGLTNLRKEFGEEGDQWQPETRQRLLEIDYILNEAAAIAGGDEARAARIISFYTGAGAPAQAAAATIEDEASKADDKENTDEQAAGK